ncbi:uncharacterized protein APUU_70827S [Aspergillus puulaauensis]|uniref:Uncharacterized protein n=1 Tax=Aspergillus puulaauensis TaxID=1220207 RepID=A0A7R7XWZ3_9EURO|nr:uncharacterized protein APUU_70827S [Aspergillus puulaauensis]BCS29257.1 hypothetical protein APUU_70827S [Aspergillus puulaauensis]
MRASITLLTAFLAAAVAQDYPFTEYVCETSDGSPYLHHVNQLIDGLGSADVGKRICNPGSGCGKTITEYSGGGGAGFMICGDSYRCGLSDNLPCAGPTCGGILARVAGEAIGGIRDNCQGPDSKGDTRVGGTQKVHYSADYVSEIRLFTRPG